MVPCPFCMAFFVSFRKVKRRVSISTRRAIGGNFHYSFSLDNLDSIISDYLSYLN